MLILQAKLRKQDMTLILCFSRCPSVYREVLSTPAHSRDSEIVREITCAAKECTSTCGELQGSSETGREESNCCRWHSNFVFCNSATLGTNTFHQRKCSFSWSMKKWMQTSVQRTIQLCGCSVTFLHNLGWEGSLFSSPMSQTKHKDHLSIWYSCIYSEKNWFLLSRVHSFKVMILKCPDQHISLYDWFCLPTN